MCSRDFWKCGQRCGFHKALLVCWPGGTEQQQSRETYLVAAALIDGVALQSLLGARCAAGVRVLDERLQKTCMLTGCFLVHVALTWCNPHTRTHSDSPGAESGWLHGGACKAAGPACESILEM